MQKQDPINTMLSNQFCWAREGIGDDRHKWYFMVQIAANHGVRKEVYEPLYIDYQSRAAHITEHHLHNGLIHCTVCNNWMEGIHKCGNQSV